MRAAAILMAAWVVLGVGCMTGPNNGETHDGAIIGTSFLFEGYTPSAGAPVELQVLSSPTADPSIDANWQTFATTRSDTEGWDLHGSILYSWRSHAIPVPNNAVAARWPAGGLVKVRALVRPGSSTYHALTFDKATWLECLFAEDAKGTPGTTIGSKCNGLGGNLAAMVSTLQNPADSSGAREFLAIKSDVSAAETDQYYAAIGAPTTLAGFRAKYVYPGTGDITATYYNDGDLGIGREMHCWSYTRSSSGLRIGKACYVSNYSDTAALPKFGANNVETALNRAVDRNGAFATVAMVYEKPIGSLGRGTVSFMVYDAAGNRTNRAQLDNSGRHTSIPNTCLTCHGVDASYNPSTNSIVGAAQFLPFDLDAFRYSSRPGFTRLDQGEAFRRLNALVRDTQPSPAIAELIDGSYRPSSVTTAGASFHGDFIPAEWQAETELDNRALYRGVVKPYCRTCHISAGPTLRDFAQVSDFSTLKPAIVQRTCQTSHPALFMPHAEHVMRRFWSSGARAYLNIWGGDITGCRP